MAVAATVGLARAMAVTMASMEAMGALEVTKAKLAVGSTVAQLEAPSVAW